MVGANYLNLWIFCDFLDFSKSVSFLAETTILLLFLPKLIIVISNLFDKVKI